MSLRDPRVDPHTGDLVEGIQFSRFVTNRAGDTIWFERRHKGAPVGKIQRCSLYLWQQWAKLNAK